MSDVSGFDGLPTVSSPAAAPAAAPAPSSPDPAPSRAMEPNPRSRGHSPAMDAREQMAVAAGGEEIVVGGQKFAQQDVLDAIAARAAADVRKQSLPASPDDYKLELPADFNTPEGLGEWQWKEGDPLLIQARAAAHEMGLTQEQFSRLLALHVGSQTGTAMDVARARTAEVAKLGPNATARVSAVQQWLRATLGDELGRHLGGDDKSMGRLFTAQDVTAFEKLISKVSSSGPGFNTRGRVEPEPGRIEGYEKMNFEQRRAAQDAARNRR